MNDRYTRILPKLDSTDTSLLRSNFPSPDLKKRRVNTATACESCRQKKTRCDGLRPTCSACDGKPNQCIYRDQFNLTVESRKLLVEVISLLAALPEADAIHLLNQVKGECDAATILNVLQKSRELQDDHSNLDINSKPERRSLLSLELETKSPNAYPRNAEMVFQSELQQNAISHNIAGPAFGTPSQDCQNVQPPPHGDSPPLCDARLQYLDIRNWTTVPIDSTIAAHIISLYLETDHPFLGFFNPDLFVASLINVDTSHCSPALVNALLYWATQVYTGIDQRVELLPSQFCAEAERLREAEREVDSTLSLATAQLLSLGYLGQGRDRAVLSYLTEATAMASRMGLFRPCTCPKTDLDGASSASDSQLLYAAWSSFNWVTHMSLFYRQRGSPRFENPPVLPIPDDNKDSTETKRANSPDIVTVSQESKYMKGVFPYLCRFWRIMHEVSLARDKQETRTPVVEDSRAFYFAEFKFRELLAWSDKLPSHLLRSSDSRFALVLHTWMHTGILDIFRSSLLTTSKMSRLRTFASTDGSPEAVCNSSVSQLKQLIETFRANYCSSTYTLLWHTGLMYLSNAILSGSKDEGWFFYVLLCVHGYERLGQPWRVTEAISRAMLSISLRNGDTSGVAAKHFFQDLLGRHQFDPKFSKIGAAFTVDLDPEPGTVESLVAASEHDTPVLGLTEQAGV